MATDKKHTSVALHEDDYQWIEEIAELTGGSRAAVIRQMVRGLRLRRPSLLSHTGRELVFAEQDGIEDSQEAGEVSLKPSKEGIEKFRTYDGSESESSS